MKKLLVILLFLFPVHGAWAEIINLKCNDSGMLYEIDTISKVVKAKNKIVSRYVMKNRETNTISFSLIWELLLNMSQKSKGQFEILEVKYSINLDTEQNEMLVVSTNKKGNHKKLHRETTYNRCNIQY